MLPTITDTALNALTLAASQIQSALLDYAGEQYEIQDLNEVLAHWLERSIESLCEDACEFCVTGDRTHSSFNRDVFEAQLKQRPSINIWEQAAAMAQDVKDQTALAVERAA